MMNKKISAWTLVCGTLGLSQVWAAQIDQVQFKFIDNQSVVEISGDSLSGFSKRENTSPPQLVLTFNDTTVAQAATRKLDTSSFKSNVLQVSAYPLSGSKNQARVVVDFKKGTHFTVDQETGRVLVKVQDTGANRIEVADDDSGSDENDADSGFVPNGDKGGSTAAKERSSDNSPLSTITNSQEDKKFTGSPITLKLKDADVHEVLRMIGEASGFNIVIHPAVQGRLTVSLEQVPWDQALDVVLTMLRLGAERSDSVLRVMPRDMLIAEKQQELETKKLSAAAAPRVTRVFPISYADLSQLSQILQNFANSQNTTPGASGVPTTIIVDANTQSLIVRDTMENIDRIKKMIQILDVQTPQVLVETKVVEASEDFTKDLNGSFGAGGTRYQFGSNGPASLVGPPTAALGDTAGAGTFAGADVFSLSGRVISLNATLKMAEKESKAKVVSSPRTVVLSGKSSSINQARSVGIQVTTPATATSPATTTIQQVTANTRLTVTPRVTNDGSVFMRLDLNRDVLNLTNTQAPAAEPRSLNTEVIVESGSTLVIGGVLNLDESEVDSGFPLLHKLPLIGWLFGSNSKTRTKSELMFFVTPRILNQKKTALSTNPDMTADTNKL
jgi:type IV pilus assembly protein PilQ